MRARKRKRRSHALVCSPARRSARTRPAAGTTPSRTPAAASAVSCPGTWKPPAALGEVRHQELAPPYLRVRDRAPIVPRLLGLVLLASVSGRFPGKRARRLALVNRGLA